MRTSRRGLDLIKSYEGLELRSYLCPAGVWTIGYGSTHNVTRNMVITEAEAEEMLQRDIQIYERAVTRALGSSVPLQEEFDAMVSLCYNIGEGNFSRSSVVRNYRAGNKLAAANSFTLWNKARVNGRLTVLQGLVRRRAEERSLFLSAEERRTVDRSVSSSRMTSVPEESVVPEAPRSLITSREVIGGTVATGAGVTQAVSSISTDDVVDVRETVEDVRYNTENTSIAEKYHLTEITAFFIVALGVFLIWKRWKDRKEGVR